MYMYCKALYIISLKLEENLSAEKSKPIKDIQVPIKCFIDMHINMHACIYTPCNYSEDDSIDDFADCPQFCVSASFQQSLQCLTVKHLEQLLKGTGI